MGVLGWESMAHALWTLGLGLGLSNYLVLLLPVTVIHLVSLFSLSSCVPVHRQSSPDLLPLLAYPLILAANLWCGLNATLS